MGELKVLSKGTVFTHTGVDPYSRAATYNFNHAPSIICMPDGKLFVVWFSGPWEGHYWQLLLSSYSEDNGLSWSYAKVIQETPHISDFDPAFIRDENRVFLFYSLARWWLHPLLAGENVGFGGMFIKYSDDSGVTWSNSIKISDILCSRTNGIRLSSGALLLPCYRQRKGTAFWMDQSIRPAGVLKSTDHGKTWTAYGEIVGPAGNFEPTIVELNTGSILMYLRTNDGYIWKSISDDEGETWSEPKKTDIVANNSSHNLYRLRDGRITLTYNPCEPARRTPLVMRLSEDDAETWSKPLILDEIDDRDVGRYAVTYPSVTEDETGKIVVVWASYRRTKTEHWGDIKMARIEVK